MNVIVFGATGTIGRHLVKEALLQGHTVTAFARRPAALGASHPNLTVRAGDVLDAVTVDEAVRGHDAVLVALGAGRKGTVRTAGTKNIVAAMSRHGMRRLICQSTLGTGDSRALLTFFWKRIMFGFLLKDAYADHEAQEDLVRNSGLDWTIVRPGAFTDGAATSVYKHGLPDPGEPLTLKISRADVAGFMLRQLTDLRYLRQSPCLSY